MPTYTGSLTPDGPIVNLAFGVSLAEQQRLQRAGMPLPTPFRVKAVVDSGALLTTTDVQLINTLQVRPFNYQLMQGSVSGLQIHKLPMFALSVTLLDDNGQLVHNWSHVRVIGTSYPSGNSIQGLFGRDLLDSCVFTYDGKQRTFTLDI